MIIRATVIKKQPISQTIPQKTVLDNYLHYTQKVCISTTLQEEIFQWNLNLATLRMKKFTKFKLCLYLNFKNLSLIAYTIGIQRSKFVNVYSREFDQSEPGS